MNLQDQAQPPKWVFKSINKEFRRSGNRVSIYFPNIDGDLFSVPNDQLVSSLPPQLEAEIKAKVIYHYHQSDDLIVLSVVNGAVGMYVYHPTWNASRGFA